MLIYPAAKMSWAGLFWVTFVFGAVTIVTMLVCVSMLIAGVNIIPLKRIERFSHAIAGGCITICGLAIQFGL